MQALDNHWTITMISCQINSLPESEHLCWKWPGLPELDLEAQCRPTTAQISMLQAWLGNRPSPSEWLKTREAGIPSMWGSTPTPPTCATEGGSMLFVSVSVNSHKLCMRGWIFFLFSYHLVLTCPSTAIFYGEMLSHSPFKLSSCTTGLGAWRNSSWSHTLLHTYTSVDVPDYCWRYIHNLSITARSEQITTGPNTCKHVTWRFRWQEGISVVQSSWKPQDLDSINIFGHTHLGRKTYHMRLNS